MSDEHKPPTDEELAEWLEYCDDGYLHLDAEDGRRLIAEVRRLRRSESSARFTKELIAEDRDRMADLYRITSEGHEKVVSLLTANHDISNKCNAELVEKLLAIINKKDRTLTLPNGTEVRAGDVLVLLSEGNGQHNVMVIRVAGLKENLLVARMIAEGQDVGSPPDWFKLRFHDGREIEFRGDADWKPWSEVYPDRPVPGGNK
jgi:hypothetical protein